MRKLAWVAACVVLGVAGTLRAQVTDVFDSVYAPPEVSPEEKGTNEGAVMIDVTASYLSDYVWRGIDRSESGGSEDSPNFQLDSSLKWDTGKWPHPFVGVFTNVYDSDNKSRFQEIRPFFGLELASRPLTWSVGHTNYIYPDRDTSNTAEVWSLLKVDDGYFFRVDKGILNPYVFGAYDYDTNHGVYLEFGVRHDFAIEDTPLTLTPRAAIAYVDNYKLFRLPPTGSSDPAFDIGSSGTDSGFQHYDIGLEATITLNQLLNLSLRYGKFDLKAYLIYTDGIDNDLRADTEWWGGVGVHFAY